MLPKGGTVDQAYYDREIPVVDRQLELGGMRLAEVLNRIFTSKPETFVPTPADSKQF